ncbi:related to Protein AF-9 homolog [Cephalotrichum gorgonifer]|uniref:Protein AF-9 homolog n=1 Tax=Cephalotrichum gorgonifer TaxID=2041049 RepID=A0AAE8SSD6_9PEZI|nr:related to Protein AF-9 homolog [Cephalotrichum gorgonifer]
MAPPNQMGKRMKGVQISRPFIYGTTARPFDEKTNPKPPEVPDGHTHSWQVFVKGVDDIDLTYWLRRVQFKFHESIPNHVRMIEGEKGKPFVINETGWGEFEITLKLYYVTESGEKAQTLYHHLRLHPYGKTEEEKKRSCQPDGNIISWNYEEQIFNEPYEPFFKVLTTGAHPKDSQQAPGGKKAPALDPNAGVVYERSALVPRHLTREQPFSRETEDLEKERINKAFDKIQSWVDETKVANAEKEKELLALRKENAAAAGGRKSSRYRKKSARKAEADLAGSSSKAWDGDDSEDGDFKAPWIKKKSV